MEGEERCKGANHEMEVYYVERDLRIDNVMTTKYNIKVSMEKAVGLSVHLDVLLYIPSSIVVALN